MLIDIVALRGIRVYRSAHVLRRVIADLGKEFLRKALQLSLVLDLLLFTQFLSIEDLFFALVYLVLEVAYLV